MPTEDYEDNSDPLPTPEEWLAVFREEGEVPNDYPELRECIESTSEGEPDDKKDHEKHMPESRTEGITLNAKNFKTAVVANGVPVSIESLDVEDGETVIESNNEVYINHLEADRVDVGLDLKPGAEAGVVNATLRGVRDTGIRLRDASLYADNLTVEGNWESTGVELNRGARATIRRGSIISNHVDMTYTHNVIAHLFDTEVTDVKDRRDGGGVRDFGGGVTPYILLWTTATGTRAQNIWSWLLGRKLESAPVGWILAAIYHMINITIAAVGMMVDRITS